MSMVAGYFEESGSTERKNMSERERGRGRCQIELHVGLHERQCSQTCQSCPTFTPDYLPDRKPRHRRTMLTRSAMNAFVAGTADSTTQAPSVILPTPRFRFRLINDCTMFRVVMAARGAGTSLVTAARVGAQVAVRATHRSAYCVPLVATVSSDGRFGRIAAGMAAVITTATAAVVGLELFPLKAECEAGAYPVYLAAPISPDLAQVRLDDPGVTIRPISHVTL